MARKPVDYQMAVHEYADACIENANGLGLAATVWAALMTVTGIVLMVVGVWATTISGPLAVGLVAVGLGACLFAWLGAALGNAIANRVGLAGALVLLDEARAKGAPQTTSAPHATTTDDTGPIPTVSA